MVERDLLFGPRTARMLMASAADERLRNHGSGLPPSWRTLYELTRLDDDAFAAAVASGVINAEMQRKDVAQFLLGRRDQTLASRSIQWPSDKFGLILADPPWRYEPGTTGFNRAIESHYPTMDLDEICALPVADIAADRAVLFLWSPVCMMAKALRVIEAWGFTYRSGMVWVKDKVGCGYIVRQRHELLLIGKRGDMPAPRPSDRPSSVIEAARGRHSAKPVEAYEVIERMYPDVPKVELFSRSPRESWAAWGNEVPQ
jgi:N6-adenosine-specific RNA methylase IME4